MSRTGCFPLLALVLTAASGCDTAAVVRHSDADLSLEAGSVYHALDLLRAGKGTAAGPLDPFPLSRMEAARCMSDVRENLEDAVAGEGPVEPGKEWALGVLESELKQDVSDLLLGGDVWFLKPLDGMRLRYLFIEGDSSFENFQGRKYSERNNLWLSFSTRFSAGVLSGWMELEGGWNEGERGELRVSEGALKVSTGTWFFEWGRETLWWGPGRHGALLLSDNAPPFDLVRMGNEAPVLLPGFFSRLGPARFELFWTKLGRDRVVPEPFLGGLRMVFEPVPNVSFGLSRTALFGGEGRPADFSTVWDLLFGRGENDPGGGPGDQLASLDWSILIGGGGPVPLQWYGEFGGEDEAGGSFSKTALLTGVFLPRLGPGSPLHLRVEYADTFMGGHGGTPQVWYTHSVYQTGYTFEGRVIGHHAGTDARDLFTEIGVVLSPAVRLTVGGDFEYRGLSLAVPEKRREFSVGLEWVVPGGKRVRFEYTWERVWNRDGVPGAGGDGERLLLETVWKF